MKIFILKVIFLIIINISFGQSRIISKHVVDSYFAAEQGCLHQYTLRIGSITKEVKADSLLCLKDADIQIGSDEMLKILQEPTKCSSGIKDYFKCIENIAPENRKKLKELTSAKESYLQNIDKIEQNKTACLSKASSKGNNESTNAMFYLNICLNTAKEQLQVKNPTPPEDMNEFLNKLDVVKEKYNQLKYCTLEKSYNFHNCFREANINEFQNYLSYRLRSNPTEYFSKITEIDKADDSCLRQYVVMNLDVHFKFDLKGCLTRQSQESEENFETDNKLVADLIEACKDFSQCRDITEHLDIYNCVSNKLEKSSNLREIQAAISRKSESFKTKFLSSYTDQYPCIENMYDFLQFDGYNLRPMEKNVLFRCLGRGYKPTVTLPFDKQLIKDLYEIQEYLKTCTEHPKSPGYERCFQNIIYVYDTTWEYLQDENLNYSETVAEHDMHHDTCFEDIVRDITERSYYRFEYEMPSQKCLFP